MVCASAGFVVLLLFSYLKIMKEVVGLWKAVENALGDVSETGLWSAVLVKNQKKFAQHSLRFDRQVDFGQISWVDQNFSFETISYNDRHHISFFSQQRATQLKVFLEMRTSKRWALQ